VYAGELKVTLVIGVKSTSAAKVAGVTCLSEESNKPLTVKAPATCGPASSHEMPLVPVKIT
jgi:hypothetical protein